MIPHYDLTMYIFQLLLLLCVICGIHLGIKVYELVFDD